MLFRGQGSTQAQQADTEPLWRTLGRHGIRADVHAYTNRNDDPDGNGYINFHS